MRKATVVKHFGSQAAVGRFLGIQRAAVNKWGPLVPEGWAAQLHVKTHGKLRYNPADYADQKPQRASLHA